MQDRDLLYPPFWRGAGIGKQVRLELESGKTHARSERVLSAILLRAGISVCTRVSETREPGSTPGPSASVTVLVYVEVPRTPNPQKLVRLQQTVPFDASVE
jgi:hypothetical protein